MSKSRGGTLRIYLEGAKDLPTNPQAFNRDDNQAHHALYPNHAVIATITYKNSTPYPSAAQKPTPARAR